MSIDRVRYQRGSVEVHGDKYYFRFRDADRCRRSVFLGNLKELSTTAKLNRAVDLMRTRINAEAGCIRDRGLLMVDLIELYKLERLPKRPSTQRGYLSKLNNHIIPRWGNTPVCKMMESAYEVEQWLENLDAAPKSKVHLRGLLSILLEHAMRTRKVPVSRNPMELVRVIGASRRKNLPQVLTYQQFAALLAQLAEPYRTMAVMGGALGLRCSEIVGLKWLDIDLDGLTITLRQAVVNAEEGELKTNASQAVLPIAAEVADVLSRWKAKTLFSKPENWVFASPYKAGRMPYHGWSAQYWALAPAGRRAGIGSIGWHDLRHTYRAWLDQTGAPMGVQKDCLRHASEATTMLYGGTVMAAKREAHGNVVERLKQVAGAL